LGETGREKSSVRKESLLNFRGTAAQRGEIGESAHSGVSGTKVAAAGIEGTLGKIGKKNEEYNLPRFSGPLLRPPKERETILGTGDV